MAITGVMRAGTVQIRVTEMGPALHHYKDVLGLLQTGEGRDGRVYLKAWDEHDHHSVVLREAESAGMDPYGIEGVRDRRAGRLRTKARRTRASP